MASSESGGKQSEPVAPEAPSAGGGKTAADALAVEIAALRKTFDEALARAGVDPAALAAAARDQAVSLERLAAEEVRRRPLRALAVAAALGALVGALVVR